jgi:hypothetical protein
MDILKLIFLFASTAIACGTEARAGAVIGLGGDSCGTFIKAIDAMSNTGSTSRASMTWEGKTWIELGASYEQWIVGYISGVNSTRATQIAIDRDGIVLSVRKICEQHPDELLVSGVSRFVFQKTSSQKRR